MVQYIFYPISHWISAPHSNGSNAKICSRAALDVDVDVRSCCRSAEGDGAGPSKPRGERPQPWTPG